MAFYYGIDFGTTNSAAISLSVINGKRIDEHTIGNDAQRPLPSYVAIHRETGVVRTGLQAKSSISDYDNYEVFSSIKSIIGEEHSWNIAGKSYTQIDIAAELFKALKTNVQSATGEIMESTVVAVPVGFSSAQKNNVRKAAKKAGLDVKMFISEPTAAYCGRADELKKYHNIAVFDWGGGTLDVVVLRVENGIIHELAASGIPVAGNTLDKKIAERICLMVARKNGVDFTYEELEPVVQLSLLSACESAKCDLADEDIATVSMANLGNYGRVYERINYDFFSLLIENEVEQAIQCLLKTLELAGMNKESIDCILCEGGSSRLRPLQTRLLQLFDREKLIFPRKAMWDIATGAAEISLKPGCYTLNKPIGVILSNNKFYPLIRAGQRIPTEEKKVKFGVIDSDHEARVVISDGDASSQTFLEYFPVRLRGFSDEELEISCYIDADMIFRMKISSNRMPDDFFRVWTYSNLKVSYEPDAPEPEIRNDIHTNKYDQWRI